MRRTSERSIELALGFPHHWMAYRHPLSTQQWIPLHARLPDGKAPIVAEMIRSSAKQRAIQIPCICLTYYLNRILLKY
jgi:hypothetical protein